MITDLHVDILALHAMLVPILVVLVIHLLQFEGEIPGLSHQDTKGIGTDLTPGHLMDREAAVEAGATVGVTAGATVEALATPGEVKYASSMNTTEDVVVF